MKNHIILVNDHSGSMASHRAAAIKDYNNTIEAIRDAATREQQDTVVSVIGFGMGYEMPLVRRQVVVSNPHVLKPIDRWDSRGNTQLYDGIGDAINLMLSLPDAAFNDVSYLVIVTTDGAENDSRNFSRQGIKELINQMQLKGNWSFVMRTPKHAKDVIHSNLGIPMANIQEWDTRSSEGLAKSTASTTAGVANFFRSRSTGAKSTSAFYSDASKVNVALLEDVTKDVSLYIVPPQDNGIEIRNFVLRHRMEYLKGAAFYQLSKTEARVSHTKKILVRDQASGKIFAGDQARSMIGLPNDCNARLHPRDHKNFDIFIQSESVNRKLVGGSGVVYWKAIGVPFTEADLAHLQPNAQVAPAVPQLLAVPPSNRPTPSPIPVTPRAVQPQFQICDTREEARRVAASYNVVQSAIRKVFTGGKKGWHVPIPASMLAKAA